MVYLHGDCVSVQYNSGFPPDINTTVEPMLLPVENPTKYSTVHPMDFCPHSLHVLCSHLTF